MAAEPDTAPVPRPAPPDARRPPGGLRRRWEWLSGLGTEGIAPSRAKRVRITNQTAAIVIAIVSIYGPIFAAIGANFLAWCIVPMVLSYMVVLASNHRGGYGTARFLMLTVGNVAVFTYSASLGLDTNIHLFFLANGLTPMLVAEPHERRLIAFGIILPFILELIRLFDVTLRVPLTPLPPDVIEILGLIMIPTCTLMVVGIVVVFYRENHQQEHRLEQLVEQLQDHGDKLRMANEDLNREMDAREQAQQEAERLQGQLLEAARKAGMADIAAEVLHEVGNATNSIGVSAKLLRDRLGRPAAPGLDKLARWVASEDFPLREQLQATERTRKLPAFLGALQRDLQERQQELHALAGTTADGAAQLERILADQHKLTRAQRIVEPVEVGGLFGAALAHAQPAGDDVRVVREHQGVPRVMLERARVEQVLVHLIDNALEALQASEGPQPTVTLRAAVTSPDALALSVADNGVGIDPERLDGLFVDGFTTKPSHRGYGLHHGANVARQLGGSLQGHSEGPGRGATFTLEVPLLVAGEHATATTIPP